MWISHCKKSSCIYNIASFGISRLPQKGISNVAVVKPIDKFILVCGLSSLSKPSEMVKEANKSYDPKLNDALCRGREKPHKGGFTHSGIPS